MNYEAFLKQYYENIDAGAKQDVIRFLKRIDEIVGDDDIGVVFQDKMTIIEVFYSSISDVSKTRFFKIKKYLENLILWLAQQGIIFNDKELIKAVRNLTIKDVLSDDKMLTTYFGDFESAIRFVDDVGRLSFDDYSGNDTLNIKALITLFWNGVDADEAIHLRKADVQRNIDRGREFYILTGLKDGRTILLSKRHFDILKDYAQIEYHRGLPSGKTQLYYDTEMLLRTRTKDGVSPNNIICTFKRFNAAALKAGEPHSIFSSVLKKNGLFEAVYINENRYGTLTQTFMRMANCDRMFAYGYKPTYLKWKRIYHPQ